MINNIKIEICIGNIGDALKLNNYPIDRIELNSALELGGLTPSIETLRYLKENINIPICVMCRPRGGNFVYNDIEFETMLKDAKIMLETRADGIVFGFLYENNQINIERTKKMVNLIHSFNAEAIFHKAFDEIDDLDEATRILIDCKVDRILTSGKAIYPNILEGCKRIKDLNDKYSDKIELLPGGGVRINNIKDVIRASNSKQIHMTSKKEYKGGYVGLDEDQLKLMLKEINNIDD